MVVKKRTLKKLLSNIVLTIFSLLLLFSLAQKQTKNTPQYSEAKNQVSEIETQKIQVFPVRLKIPSINVDTSIEYMGLTSTGAMEAPKSIINVGWFGLGPRPGERGSAVIGGHFDGERGEMGVFAYLYKLKAGDILYIEDSRGMSTTFVVRESRMYDPGYADEVFSRNDGTYLNLVTCDGVWDGIKKSYSKRLVVFADMVE